MTLILGVDPGLDGALALISTATVQRPVVGFWDIPTLEVKSGKTTRREYDVGEVLNILRYIYTPELVAAVEKIGPMPSQRKKFGQEKAPTSSAVTNFSMGQGLMLWKAVFAALGIPYDLVPAATWKAALRVPKGGGKDAGRQRALELFPSASPDLSRKKDNGRADALLIAAWRSRQALPLTPAVSN